MKRSLLTFVLFYTIMTIQANNPLLEKYNTPHETAHFDKIKIEHYEPAIDEGIRQQVSEIEDICNNPELLAFKIQSLHSKVQESFWKELLQSSATY